VLLQIAWPHVTTYLLTNDRSCHRNLKLTQHSPWVSICNSPTKTREIHITHNNVSCRYIWTVIYRRPWGMFYFSCSHNHVRQIPSDILMRDTKPHTKCDHKPYLSPPCPPPPMFFQETLIIE